MRCREVKRRISDGSVRLDREVQDHIQNCPECSRAAEASRELEAMFVSARADSEPGISFESVRDLVTAGSKARPIVEAIMSQLRYQVRTRPRLLTGFGLALVVFLCCTLIPFSYQQTVGYKVTVVGLGAELEASPEILTGVLGTIGFESVKVEQASDSTPDDYVFTGLSSESDAEEMAEAFSSMVGYQGNPVVEPVVEVVSGSIYAQVAKKVKEEEKSEETPISISFDDGHMIINSELIDAFIQSGDLSDAEVEEELRSLFLGSGVHRENVEITVKTDTASDSRAITLKFREGKVLGGEAQTMSIYISDGDFHLTDDSLASNAIKEAMIFIEVPGADTLTGDSMRLDVKLRK